MEPQRLFYGELVKRVAKDTGYTLKDVDKVMDTAMQTIMLTLLAGGAVTINGFWNLSVRVRAPQKCGLTGDMLPERRRVVFTTAGGFKADLNRE